MVPEPDVLHGEVVLLQILRRQVVVRRELLLFHLSQSIGKPCVLNILLQVRLLGHDLVGNDLEFLHDGGINSPSDNVCSDQEQNRRCRNPPIGPDGKENRRDACDAIEAHDRFQDPELSGDVRISGAENHPSLYKEDFIEVEPGAEDPPAEEQGGQQRQMHPGGRGDGPVSGRDEKERSPDKVDKSCGRQRDQKDEFEPSVQVEEKGELKDIEAHILSEERIRDTEGSRIQEQQKIFPLVDSAHRRENTEENRSRENQHLEGSRGNVPQRDRKRSHRIREAGFTGKSQCQP